MDGQISTHSEKGEKELSILKERLIGREKENCVSFPKETVVGRGKKKKKKKSSPILEDREVQKINKRSSFQEENKGWRKCKKKRFIHFVRECARRERKIIHLFHKRGRLDGKK